MKTVHLIFFDAGGGHRSAANALRQVIEQQKRGWRVELLNLQELFDPIDLVRRLTGVRMQDVYNLTLKNGYTLGWARMLRAMQRSIRLYHPRQVQLLEAYWAQNPSDLVVSLIPNFNRALFESLENAAKGVPLMTVMTDLADFSPHFWIERQHQYLVCGSDKAVRQAHALGYEGDQIFRASGMILNPQFYDRPAINREAERAKLGLDPTLPTAVVLFGGHGSKKMLDIATSVAESRRRIQLILLCGHNEELAAQLKKLKPKFPMHVQGFTREVFHYMQLADFFIGKPGPGCISEALAMKLPVIVERNAWTLPQERYNTDWIQEQGVGIVVRHFRTIDKAIGRMLLDRNYKHFRERAASHQNSAVFDIPDMMLQVMEESPVQHPSAPARRIRKTVAAPDRAQVA